MAPGRNLAPKGAMVAGSRYRTYKELAGNGRNKFREDD
jgi:hypothetical protein